MPCECIYALMMRAYALDGTTCMTKKLKLHSRVKIDKMLSMSRKDVKLFFYHELLMKCFMMNYL